MVAAVLALSGLTLTVMGYADGRRERAESSCLYDFQRFRELVGDFAVGAKLWRTYLGIGLTAASVVVSAAGSVLGSLSE
jgi:hypothetical protein